MFVVVGSSNAVNITDGLDGLAIGLMVISAGALTILRYTSGNRELANYLQLARNPRTAELTIFCGSMTGASLGFLWWNAHPADIFMGDVGSLSLGGAMGVVAVLIKQEILLIFIAGMFVVELMSVILQVGSYKLRKKTNFQNGADSSSLRGARMAGIENHCAVLDRGPGDGAVRADHFETDDGIEEFEGIKALVVGMEKSGRAVFEFLHATEPK